MENILTEQDLPESYGIELELNAPFSTSRTEVASHTLGRISNIGIPLMRWDNGNPIKRLCSYHERRCLSRDNPLAGWKVERDCSLDSRYGSEWVSHILEKRDFPQVKKVVSILNDSGYRETKKGGIHLNYAHSTNSLVNRNFDSLFVLGWDAIGGILPPRRRHQTFNINGRTNYARIPSIVNDYQGSRAIFSDYSRTSDREMVGKYSPHNRKFFGTEVRYFPSNLVWDDIQAYFFLVGRMLRMANSTTLIATNPEWDIPLERDDPMLDFLNRLGVSGGSVANHLLGMWDDWKEWENSPA